jgi:REP element-mobilizing transposase RayT
MSDQSGRNRRSIRLRDWDYASGGLYFLTICADKARCIFGRVHDGGVQLNRLARIVEDQWTISVQLRRYLDLDAYVIMPNHMHAVVAFLDQRGDEPRVEMGARSAPLRGMQPRSLSSFIAGFKASCTRSTREMLPGFRLPVWQRNYYEHVVRDERDLERIRGYIAANPARREEDGYHPTRLAGAGAGAHSRAPLRGE